MPTAHPDVALAAALLRAGKLVAFPTETVYGLGADATNPTACGRVFALKGRPATNPLIVHVADTATARHYTAAFPRAAELLAEQFWPGPLTLVLPRHPSICREATAGRETVAVRVPDHDLALDLLRQFGGPVAAPSANRTSRVSPTSAEHVRAEFGDAVDLILDGGPCPVGIESTVLDLTTFPKPTLLRPGSVSIAQLEPLIGPIEMAVGRVVPAGQSAPSPGLSELHYAPMTPAYRFTREQYPRLIDRLGDGAMDESLPDTTTAADRGSASAVLLMSKAAIPSPHDVISMPTAPEAYARQLYATLRSVDAGDYAAIYIELPPETPEWLAVRDRLMRATRPLP
ncbi:MAG: L-threonylcarbamoyladenylate synthase [Tepidisphaerales bacterium]